MSALTENPKYIFIETYQKELNQVDYMTSYLLVFTTENWFILKGSPNISPPVDISWFYT